MSAALLRDAATLMRSRASAVDGDSSEWWNVDSFAEVTNYDDAEHFVAFGRPVVAIAVADWLDLVARLLTEGFDANAETRAALNVARAYLGVGA